MTAAPAEGEEAENSRPLLVIGYGSELRGDDAVGLRAAETAAGWGHPRVQAVAAHQLLPELAETVSAARAVVFIDADVLTDSDRPAVRPVGPSSEASSLGHTGDPAWLMELSERLYGRRPEAWLLAIPVSDMEMRMSLSEQAESMVSAAISELASLAARYGIVVEERAEYA